MSTSLTRHEELIADDLIRLIDYAGRVLVTAAYGSYYQLDKAHELRACADRLITHLDKQTCNVARAAAVQAAVAQDANLYTLGRILLDAGRLGGAA